MIRIRGPVGIIRILMLPGETYAFSDGAENRSLLGPAGYPGMGSESTQESLHD